MLLYGAGLRISEALGLKGADMPLGETLVLTGKGGKQRVVPILPVIRQAVAEYVSGAEGRLMRSLKSLLGSKLLKSETTVLGSAMPFKDILGLFLGTLKTRAEAAAGRSFEQAVLGRPVFFVDDDESEILQPDIV